MSKLLFVVNDAPFFISHRLPLALGARAAGYAVYVATPDHARRVEIESHGLQFHPIPLARSTALPVSEARTFLALLRLYRRLKPDLVHHVTHKPVLYGSIAARIARVPAVVNAISGLGYAFIAPGLAAGVRRRAMMLAYRVAFHHPRCAVIFQNREDMARFAAAGVLKGTRVVLIPGSGVDLQRFRREPEPAGIAVVLLAARMLWDKGVGDFVAAANLLRASGVPFRAILAGSPDPGNPRSVTTGQLEEWARRGEVEWLGHQPDMAALLARSHVVCLPSCYGEGVPKYLLEGAASGRPIVTTDVPGCRDVVRPGENGLIVPPGNPERLAEAIGTLLLDPHLRESFGLEGRRRAEAEFGVDHVVATTLQLYAELDPHPEARPRLVPQDVASHPVE